MISKKKLLGASLVTAAALTFSTLPVTLSLAMAKNTEVKCYGVNSCKGTSACKTATNSCKGKNSCKTKGFVMQKTAEDCKTAGGSTVEK